MNVIDYSTYVSFIGLGLFLRTILNKFDNMLQNSLTVNLLLTGIIARLAHYCQPMLRSFLLNPSRPMANNVKSLFQVEIYLSLMNMVVHCLSIDTY
jgi:nucleosome binding factor SPN SPT16 subunit